MISVEHLTKYYGNFLAVDDISFFTSRKGMCMAFWAPTAQENPPR